MHLLRHMGICCPCRLLFHQQILIKHWFHFAKKESFHRNCEKLVKSAIFEVEKPEEMGPDLQKFKKKKKEGRKKKTVISYFLKEKNS